MTSQARLAANRRNARLSTGPRSEAGKARSRRNALRHGLNSPLGQNPALVRQIADSAAALAAVSPGIGSAAERVAELVVHLRRVRAAKCLAVEQAQRALTARGAAGTPELEDAFALAAALPDLLRLDGYERKAFSRLRRALLTL